MDSKEHIINFERLIGTFFDILKIKSPSKKEREIADYIEKKLKKMGLEIYRDNSGEKFGSNAGNIIAVYKSKIPSKKKPIFLCAHLDTVHLEGDVVPVIEDDRVINQNTACILGADDKAAVAAILEALNIIIEKKIKTADIYIIFTISEEIGLLGAKNLNLSRVKAETGFVFDGEGDIGIIINKAPYQNSINAQFIGKAAHAGASPEKGINAIKVSADAISSIKLGRIDKETTSNVGKIEGGVARNIVPENTKVQAEARSIKLPKLDKITFEIISSFEKAAKNNGAKVKYEVIREYDGFEIGKNKLPVRIASAAIKRLGIKPKVMPSGGGSDINIFNSKGKTAVNLSSGIENAHTNEEYVKISELKKLVCLIVEICKLTY